jgi:thiol-disulfide isomerase/thioredoxin
MKKLIVLTLFFRSAISLFAQDAVLHISIANSKASACKIWFPSKFKERHSDIALTRGNAAEKRFRLKRPCFVYLHCAESDDRNPKRFFDYTLYLSPGDSLQLKADFNKPDYDVAVTGKGASNNQPQPGLKEWWQYQAFNNDTLPARVINALNADQRGYENALRKYIASYKPSQDYIRTWKAELAYVIACNYYFFKENNKYRIGDAYERNYPKWQNVDDSLFATAKFGGDDRLTSKYYVTLVTGFLTYERERLLYMAERKPVDFYKKWYGTDTIQGKKLLISDRSNIPKEKVINKYFTGKSAEFAYAVLLESAIDEAAPQNAPEIFERFKNNYPQSEYITLFAPSINKMVEQGRRSLNDKMIFLADNGTRLNTLEEVIAAMKGKTVLVDMWGSWCGPCREDIEKHSSNIRHHFKDKNLDYLYIANYDLENNAQWKKLIAYFDMEGTHIMANENLTKDIMSKVKGRGFPTTFIIKKDGTVELAKSQYPMEENIMINQLEVALKE